jgi:hypothetical protein
MSAEPIPSPIVPVVQQLAEALEGWARAHRGASLAEHERGVLELVRRALGPLLGATVGRALGLDHPAAVRVRAACPGCRRRQPAHGWRERRVLTACGPMPLRRPYFWCRRCRRGWVPADATLELGPGQALSAGAQAWLVLLGALLPFRRAAAVLEELTGLGVGAETVRAATEAVGDTLAAAQERAAARVERTREPAEPLEPAPGLLVVEADGVMVPFTDGWHEAKLGLVAGCRPGQPGRRGPLASASHRLLAPSYLAARASAEEFGPRLLAEAARRGALEVVAWEGGPTAPGLARLPEVVVLGDGAPWIWHLAAEHFAARTEVVDWYHASEHLWALARALHGPQGAHTAPWARRALAVLWHRGAGRLLAHLRRARPADPTAAEALRLERGYFAANAARMDYPAFRARGLPVGSGAVESAAKHVVQQRMKRAGMRWGMVGGQALLALCAHLASDRPLLPLVRLRLQLAA